MDEFDDTIAHPQEVVLLDYVVGELGPDRSDAIRRHVDSCPNCRERIVTLAMSMDEIDRLPVVGIPHDLLLGSLKRGRERTPLRRSVRSLPWIALALAVAGVIALFQVGSFVGDSVTLMPRQVVLQTTSADPVKVINELLTAVPHRVVVDRDDERHLVVLVANDSVDEAIGRLSGTTSPNGLSYVVEIAGTGIDGGSTR